MTKKTDREAYEDGDSPNERAYGASDAKCSPAPWIVKEGEDSGLRVLEIEAADGRYIAQVECDEPDAKADEGWVPEPEGRANAALMVAAPDHNSASISTVDRLSDLPAFLEKNGFGAIASVLREELEKHRAAIARAELRTP